MVVRQPVTDKTGLVGGYNLQLSFAPEMGAAAGITAPIDSNAPSLFTALREQLGLKLDAETGPVEVLVIDSRSDRLPIRTACERRRIRFDIRYFQTFDDLQILGVSIAESLGKVDFTRASLGFVLRF